MGFIIDKRPNLCVSNPFAGDDTPLFELVKSIVSGRPVTTEFICDFGCS